MSDAKYEKMVPVILAQELLRFHECYVGEDADPQASVEIDRDTWNEWMEHVQGVLAQKQKLLAP